MPYVADRISAGSSSRFSSGDTGGGGGSVSSSSNSNEGGGGSTNSLLPLLGLGGLGGTCQYMCDQVRQDNCCSSTERCKLIRTAAYCCRPSFSIFSRKQT
jgi:hypothetical protein